MKRTDAGIKAARASVRRVRWGSAVACENQPRKPDEQAPGAAKASEGGVGSARWLLPLHENS